MTITTPGTPSVTGGENAQRRAARQISEREIAEAVLMSLAEIQPPYLARFSLFGFYDDDAETIDDIAKRLRAERGQPLHNKLRKVCRKLVQYGVLGRRRQHTDKQYVGEPTHQYTYELEPKYCFRLAPHVHTHYKGSAGPEFEMNFILRHAYPNDDTP